MDRTVNGVVYATHTFAVPGGKSGRSVDEMLEVLERDYPGVSLYFVFGVRAAPGAMGIIMVQLSVRVSLASVEDAVELARSVACSRFKGMQPGEWGVVDENGVDLVP